MAEQNLYEVLGVKRDATADDIRKSYRKLAKEFHPDLNPGKPAAEARFKSITAAYDILSDPEKRGRYDRGEIDESGAERPRYSYRPHAEGAQGWKYRPQGEMGAEDLEDLFAMFGGGAGRARGAAGTGNAGFRMPGQDRHFTLTIDFVTAIAGGKQRLALGPDEWLDVTIPVGLEEGQVLRLKGKGGPGFGQGAPPGDALIEVHIEPHPWFRREGEDIHMELPVSLAEAVLGARVPVATVTGPVTMTIPKGSDSGTRLRLRGKGVRRHRRGGHHSEGDQYVTLKVVIGAADDPELAEFMQRWAEKHPSDPRRGAAAQEPQGSKDG